MKRTMVWVAALTLGVTAAGVSAAWAEDIEIEPGQWIYSIAVGQGEAPLNVVDEDSECVTPEESKQSLSELLAEGEDSCTYSNIQQAGGRITGEMYCKSSDSPMETKGNFTVVYDRTSVEITGESTISMAGNSSLVRFKNVGKHIGPCS